MIGTIQIKCSAHNPSMPLCPVFAFQDSYQQVRISDVPKKIGDWSIKRVEVECQFPDNKVGKFDCSLIGGVWATTISACSTAGTSKNGFVVNGYDENGNKYVLGKSDLYIMTNDSRIVPQKELVVVNILPNKPDAPHIGDIVFVDGKFEIYDGEKWFYTSYIESEDGTQRIYGNGDVSTLSSAPGTYGPWTDEDGNVDETWHVIEVSASVFAWSSDDGYRISRDRYGSREEAQNAKKFTSTDNVVWTKPYTPGSQSWFKEGELALKSDIPTKTSQLENNSNLLSATKTADGYYNIDTNKSYMAVVDVMGREFMTEYATKTELDTVNRNLTTAVLDMQKELDQKATIEYVDDAIGNVLTQEEF